MANVLGALLLTQEVKMAVISDWPIVLNIFVLNSLFLPNLINSKDDKAGLYLPSGSFFQGPCFRFLTSGYFVQVPPFRRPGSLDQVPSFRFLHIGS